MIKSPAGTYSPTQDGTNFPDPGGTYSAAGATAPTDDPAGMYSSPYALNDVLWQWNQRTSTVPMSFTSETAVADYYGATSLEAEQAKEFFYGKTYAGVGQFITVRVGLGQRDHLLGGNLSTDTLAQLQAIQGTVSLQFDGFTYTGALNLVSDPNLVSAGFAGVMEVGHQLQDALNANRTIAAVTTNDTIVPGEAEFWGYTSGAQLYVTNVVSGTIEPGGYVTGKGLGTGTASQIIANRDWRSHRRRGSIIASSRLTVTRAAQVIQFS